ncbi:MAG TPA: AMP-binding protein, partial [Burkholderiales bacterium]|nr:AMP-binding protein [Burkholderiales bacterium]
MRERYADLYRSYRWSVPARFNIAQACCGQWAADRSRFALYSEDESGASAAFSFWDIQLAANRLSNALAALGVQRGERVALMLPQRPESAIAYMAIFQLGAIALPLSHLFGPDAIEYRMNHAEASVAIVEPATLANLWAVKDRLSTLRHVIGVGGARETGVHAWEALLAKGARTFRCADTSADDPAVIIYTSGTTGAPKGALEAHRLIIGNISGFVHSHDFYPQKGDMFWSPADWAWAGGLFDALLPAWYFGMPILGYRGRFDAEKAYYLVDKYGVRNAFLFPTALKLMMKALPEPRRKYELNMRSIMSAGESVGVTLIEWAREQLGVTINEMFGQTEINYVVGNCQAAWPVKPGAIGRPYPGHRVAVIDEQGNELPPGELGEIAIHRRCNGELDPVFFLEYWKNPQATRDKFLGDWGCTGDQGKMDEDGYLWYQGRSDDV